MTNTPLNPDALETAYAKYAELSVEEWRTRPHSAWRERVIEDVNIAVSAYLEVAQPVVSSVEELDKLPFETVIRDSEDFVFENSAQLGEDPEWWSPTDLLSSTEVTLPARILYLP